MPRRLLWILAAAPLVGACRSSAAADEPRVLSVEEPDLTAEAAEAGFSSRTLFSSPLLSAHVTRVSAPLRAHYHASHEETAYVIRGRARMRIGETWHELGPGDLVHLPRGVVHEVLVEDSATVLSLFAPPFDGLDRVFPDDAPAP